MNFSDSEIVASVLLDCGYTVCNRVTEADVVFINTCSIRENAELRVRKRLRELKSLKDKNSSLVIGVLGCMAERLKDKLLREEIIVDIVAGPDSYRSLPAMLNEAFSGQKAINIILSEDETYAEIEPVRYHSNGVSAFISIMRGCQNFCSYCVVPFTRGKERSRDYESILEELDGLTKKEYKEVTLLGQNVNSYKWINDGKTLNFSDLMALVARSYPEMRIRFATSHPKDISNDLIDVIASYKNICKHIHLPVQSGSNKILKLMHRKYTTEWYLERLDAIRKVIPDIAISTDIITGFCNETEDDHRLTIELMKECKFDFAFMFAYSERPDTSAAEKYEDNVPESVKKRRLNEVIDLQQKLSRESNELDIGKSFEVLVEGHSKKSEENLFGRNSHNKVVVFPAGKYVTGDKVNVKITGCTSATLLGKPIC